MAGKRPLPPTDFTPYDPLDDETRHWVAPPPDVRNGKWLTGAQVRSLIERFGPAYVDAVKPEWARGGEQ